MAENGSGKPETPHYLRSLAAGKGDKGDNLLTDWTGQLARVRELLLGLGARPDELPGTSLTLERDVVGMRVVVRTTRYGYLAEFHGKNLLDILEQVENCLATETMPWKPDWQRSKESRKRLDIV